MIYVLMFVGAYLMIWFIGWLLFDKYGNHNPKVSFIFKWYDGWVGWFWDTKKRWLYIFLLPFFGVVIKPFRKNFLP